MSERIFPRLAPNWFRPVWCFFKGYHRAVIEIPAGMAPGSHINCGCCTKRRATIIEIDFTRESLTLGELAAAGAIKDKDAAA